MKTVNQSKTVRLKMSIIKDVEKLAEAENRKLSNMIETILIKHFRAK